MKCCNCKEEVTSDNSLPVDIDMNVFVACSYPCAIKFCYDYDEDDQLNELLIKFGIERRVHRHFTMIDAVIDTLEELWNNEHNVLSKQKKRINKLRRKNVRK